MGKKHRLGGPAIIMYYKNGQIELEHWYQNDEYHSEDCPAVIEYSDNGQIVKEEWYTNGINIDVNRWLIENNIHKPYDEADLMAIKLRWIE